MANSTCITNDVVSLIMEINQVNKSEKIAEYTSSCPDLPIKFHCTVESAREAMAALFIMVTVLPERSGLPKMYFTDHIARMCFNYKYEGQWRTVQEILELSTLMPYQIGEILLSNMSKEDFYGNFVPLVRKLTKTIKVVKAYQKRNHKVKRTQRKRGYDDKGTLRLSHQWLPDEVHIGENPIREDRRGLSYSPRTSLHWNNNYLRRDST